MALVGNLEPPYYAVIFTSIRTNQAEEEYQELNDYISNLAVQQPGFLGMESARNNIGVTAVYWRDLESIQAWRANAEHAAAKKIGREKFYEAFHTRICKVEREYGWTKPKE
ncbi:antibiotic biosynthesis monooxygenase [bacterium SCSIO 12741]|nr:antibiotic biosynthesis monooxygenase [bacterium SCSIO 12741]